VENALFDSGSLAGPQAFSFNNLAGAPDSGKLFSMGETLELTLGPGAIVGVQGISMTAAAIPELPTWAMALAGFGLFGLLGRRRQQVAQRAAFAD
jgi:MYXO-CTERM domain-containing protein